MARKGYACSRKPKSNKTALKRSNASKEWQKRIKKNLKPIKLAVKKTVKREPVNEGKTSVKYEKNRIAEQIAEKLKLRKLLKENINIKPKKRRGRRPKPITEYNYDSHHEQDNIVDVDYSRLEYDTGISVNKLSDDYDYNDFDDNLAKELDFDTY